MNKIVDFLDRAGIWLALVSGIIAFYRWVNDLPMDAMHAVILAGIWFFMELEKKNLLKKIKELES